MDDPMPSEQYGEYTLIASLGKDGGEAYLWKATKVKSSGSPVVTLRILKKRYENITGDVKRHFEREVQIYESLKGCPHIISLLDSDWNNGKPYLVMSYIPRGSLGDMLKEKLLPPEDCLAYILQTAEALIHVHHKGIIHRDVKPANMLLDSSGILLSDFGLAIDANTLLLTSRKNWGSGPYCPPEQGDGHPVKASDQYALAVTMCKLFTGKLPDEGGKEDLKTYFPNIYNIFMRASKKKHKKRYSSIEAFASALRKGALSDSVIVSPSVQPLPPPVQILPPRRPPWGNFHRLFVVILIAVVVLVSTGVFVWIRWPMVSNLSISEFPMRTQGSLLSGITHNPKGSIEFIELEGHVWQWPLASLNQPPILISFYGNNSLHLLGAITSGANDTFWVTDRGGHQIIRFNADGGQQEPFPLPSGNDPTEITKGLDGNLWFTESLGNKIGRITPNGQITEFDVPTSASLPAGITKGPDGNLWFTESLGNKIGRITPNGQITEFGVPTSASLPAGITEGSDGNLWFTESLGNKIGRITPNGQITEFDVPTSASFPAGITKGPDGNLWFTETIGNQIGRITPNTSDGQIRECPLPQLGSRPNQIITGQGNTLWFTEAAGRVGRITLQTGSSLFGWLDCS